MTEAEIIKRKIKLKRQARRIIKDELEELGFRLQLLRLKGRLEAQITDAFDPALSRKIDCVLFLLET